MWSLLLIWATTSGGGFAEKCEKIVDNKTCILGEGTCHLDWPGELVIPDKRQMVCPSVALTADRFVMKSDSNIYTTSTIKINARTMTFNNSILTSNSTFLRENEHCEGIQVVNSGFFVKRKLVMKCQDGTVNVTGNTILQAAFNVSLRAKFVSFPDFYVKLMGRRINLSAEQLHLRASITGTPDLVAMAQYEASLGWLGGTWTLGSLVAAAETLSFAMDHRVEVLGTSCDNQELPRRRDYCQELLHSWPWSEQTLGAALTWVDGLKFTSVIFASKEMHMKPRTRFVSASALFCAGEELNLENASSILSQGKGCSAGEGDGAGEVRTHFELCGGGGASNLGAGGDGALRVEGEKALMHCAAKGFITEWDGLSLPLTGASGGGCSSGLRPQLQSSSLAFSAGGGLLWLSTPKLYLNASSRVKADGLQGTMVGKSAKLAMATGGGAGGQILIFTEDIRVEECMDEDCEPPELSAEGGDAHCSSAQNTVGGAGGGGFIGLWWLGGAPTAHEDLGQLVKLQVAGGTLTKTCADVLSQDLHSDVLGRPGLAVSLAPCPEGHAGPFCASCPVGQWGSGHGHGHCHHCDNKPQTPNAVYAKMAWPNSSCPFHCVPGVPEVKMNPNCLSNFDFAMGFFGGKLGFKITLALPITIFFIIRLVHSLRRKRRTRPSCGRWQFPREELPCHVARIYLLGNNSADSPWTLPERGHGATVLDMLGEDLSQALEETLQKPLKIARWESWWLLQLSPWLELLLLRRRLGRAKRAQRAVLLAAESSKDMEGQKPSVKFGCDESATTGYLDIFDFGRSALDWAPRNLKEEEQLLLAQGAGTWARPYELNIADPLLLGVAQSQGSQGPIGSQMIYSLVCAFNLFSRLVPSAELLDVLWGDEAPAFAVLQREVELSARRLSLQAAAQVQILRMSRGHKGEPEVSTAGFATKPPPAGPESFTDLVQQLPLEGAPTAIANKVEELKLCLVLRAEKDRRLLRQSGEESGLKKPQGFFYTLRRSLLRFRSQRLLRWVRVPNAAAKLGISNLVVSLFFFMLILFEGMASVILWSAFSRLEIEQAIWLWMLFPSPLAPLSPLLGLAALLLRRPWFCRLQAHLSFMASINLVVVGFTYGQEGLLKPCLVLFLLHVVVCYFAAIYSGLEMSSADVQLAEDSGGDASLQSLRDSSAPVPRRSLAPLPLQPRAESDGICLALWPGRRSRARPHADSVDSDVGGAAAEASPF